MLTVLLLFKIPQEVADAIWQEKEIRGIKIWKGEASLEDYKFKELSKAQV